MLRETGGGEEREGWVESEGWKESIGRRLGGECRRRGGREASGYT